MAEKDKEIDNSIGGNTQVIAWTELGKEDSGKPVNVANAIFKTVQFHGVFGGAAVSLEGSIDGKNFHALTDPQGNPVKKSTSGLEMVEENVVWVRPNISGGSSDTKIDVRLLMKFER